MWSTWARWNQPTLCFVIPPSKLLKSATKRNWLSLEQQSSAMHKYLHSTETYGMLYYHCRMFLLFVVLSALHKLLLFPCIWRTLTLFSSSYIYLTCQCLAKTTLLLLIFSHWQRGFKGDAALHFKIDSKKVKMAVLRLSSYFANVKYCHLAKTQLPSSSPRQKSIKG